MLKILDATDYLRLERQMPEDNEPEPAAYSLDERMVKYFSTSADKLDFGWLGSLAYLGWLGLCAGMVLLWELHVKDVVLKVLTVLILLLWYTMFLLPFKRLGVILFKRRQTRHKLYPKWQEYEAGRLKWEHQQALLLQQQAEERRLREAEEQRQSQRRVDWWKGLNGKQFETELADLFSQRGCEVKLTPHSGDGGVDIRVTYGKKGVIVQCKAQARRVSSAVVRDLYGTMMHEKADEAWLVTTTGFSASACDFARGKPIRLITIDEIISKTRKEDV